MSFTEFAGRALRQVLNLRYPGIRVGILTSEHQAVAVELLAREFCDREPLCSHLGMNIEDIRPFFNQLVQQVVDQRLGIVAFNRQRELLGVMTVEDHLDCLEPQDATVDELNIIGEYLDSLSLPEELQPMTKGEVFYCGLAAVNQHKKNSAILTQMMLFCFIRLKRLGYKRGYAKVTNKAIIRRFRYLEKITKSNVFQCLKSSRPLEFNRNGSFPFQAFEGKTHLFVWTVP